ncbi:GTP-binding protein HflX [Halarsenatibacter silvermanii]|uniref:GTPase HflX n=1 Tax=Halarsenatibacter silvermanii TaxID=321763 RepID=A0A1G9P733_9FIRM|nr:GTP-binding protein HflX [Halarsenatibacter silvermanii]
MKSRRFTGGINIIKDRFFSTAVPREKVLLVGNRKNSLEELAELTRTAGGEVEKKTTHSPDNVNPAFYIGRGKLFEVKAELENSSINLVIIDGKLSPAQHRNLEEELETRVIDRNQLILDIFSLHARTKESKLQVEKAQLEYLFSRLTGKGEEMSRLAGGIGTRGPGETKLETDRRRISDRIHRLKQELKDISRTREVQRQDREDPVIALTGYTNAGKSTLLNQITGGDNMVADQLFATLDSTLHKFNLPSGKRAIITDTVGFIRNLPHQLIASFRATLEEITRADIILHIVDGSTEGVDQRINVVEDVLNDLEADPHEEFLIINKIDKISGNKLENLKTRHPDACFISARTGDSVDELLELINSSINQRLSRVSSTIPYNQAGLVEKIHNRGQVEEEEYSQEGISITALVPEDLAKKTHRISGGN